MSKTDGLEQIIQIAESLAKANGLVVVDARFSQQGSKRSLEVTIHRPSGQVSLSDCESFSRELEPLLDNQLDALMAGSFLLEVQSPGIDRQLKTDREFAVFDGYAVEVKAKEDLLGLGYTMCGVLKGKTSEHLNLEEPQAVVTANSSKSKSKKKSDAAVQTAIPSNLQIDLKKVVHVRLHTGDLTFRDKDNT